MTAKAREIEKLLRSGGIVVKAFLKCRRKGRGFVLYGKSKGVSIDDDDD